VAGVRRHALVARRVFREAVIACVGVFVYFGVRGLTEGDVTQANQNAARVIRLERAVGMFWERSLQAAVDGSHLAVTLANWEYVWGHWPLIIATLCWLAIKHPGTYRFTRNTMLLSGAVGLVVFAAFPVTPPRLFDPELVDTVTEYSRSYRVLQPPAFVNQYAAMPSLHVGWDALIGIALAGHARRRWVRWMGALLPAAMVFAVVLTANHYVLDVIAGLALILVTGILVTHYSTRRDRTSPPATRASPRVPDRHVAAMAPSGSGPWHSAVGSAGQASHATRAPDRAATASRMSTPRVRSAEGRFRPAAVSPAATPRSPRPGERRLAASPVRAADNDTRAVGRGGPRSRRGGPATPRVRRHRPVDPGRSPRVRPGRAVRPGRRRRGRWQGGLR
jgi:membrane-associated phospholipid phosphatase